PDQHAPHPTSSSFIYPTIPPPPRPTLFPYTTLFRSDDLLQTLVCKDERNQRKDDHVNLIGNFRQNLMEVLTYCNDKPRSCRQTGKEHYGSQQNHAELAVCQVRNKSEDESA